MAILDLVTLTLITGSAVVSIFTMGFLVIKLLSAYSKSNLHKNAGMINFEMVSANVLPVQTLLPPRKGVKANGCLFFPSGYKEYSLYESNLSGMNFSGSIQYFGLR